MDSSMCLSAPDPKMWIIQGTLAWRIPLVQTRFETKLLLKKIDGTVWVRFNVDPTFYSLSEIQVPLEEAISRPLSSRSLILYSNVSLVRTLYIYIYFTL